MTARNPISHAILVRARQILAQPQSWTKGEAARDAKGHATACSASDATCFCTIGAVERARHEMDAGPAEIDRALDAIRAATNRVFISAFNDDLKTKHEDVLAVLDTAISNMEPTP